MRGLCRGAVARRRTDLPLNKALLAPGDYASSETSSVSAVSSISMSLNSSESKTSPHSRHSTNSVSSCRETIRTFGCLQAVAIVLSLYQLELTLFPADCSRVFCKFKRLIVALDRRAAKIFLYQPRNASPALVMPTETVVY